MRIFVTGATGFIGIPVVKDLISAGHKVLGMARSEEGAKSLKAIGADVRRGSIEDLESLKDGAAAADAVIHLAFIHDFSKFQENCERDRRAIETLGAVLAGSRRPLIVTTGTAGLAASGQVATEDMDVPPNFPFPRVSEQAALALKDVNASVMRLPQVHNTVRQGLVTYLITAAREKGLSAFVGEGRNRWAAGHVSDVARLYRLALEKSEPGAKYHAVGEEGVSMRDIAEVIGRGLELPVKSLSPELPLRCGRALGAFTDERYRVAGDEGGRGWARSAHPVPWAGARTDVSRFTPARSSPLSAAATNGLDLQPVAVRHVPAYAYLVVSFATGAAVWIVGGRRGGWFLRDGFWSMLRRSSCRQCVAVPAVRSTRLAIYHKCAFARGRPVCRSFSSHPAVSHKSLGVTNLMCVRLANGEMRVIRSEVRDHSRDAPRQPMRITPLPEGSPATPTAHR